MIKLDMKPCPNCGNRHAYIWRDVFRFPGMKYFCECTQCHWRSKGRYFKRCAIRAWKRGKGAK